MTHIHCSTKFSDVYRVFGCHPHNTRTHMSNYMAEVGPAACTRPYMDAYTHTVLGRKTGPCVLLVLVRVNLGITNPNLNQKMQQPIPFNTQAQRHQTCRRFRFQHNRNILWHLYMGLYGYRSCSPAAASILRCLSTSSFTKYRRLHQFCEQQALSEQRRIRESLKGLSPHHFAMTLQATLDTILSSRRLFLLQPTAGRQLDSSWTLNSLCC